MMDYDVTIDTKGVEEMLGDLANKTDLVIARAANRSATTMKKVIKHDTVERYRLKYGDVEKTLDVKKANRSKPFVALRSNGYHFRLHEFKVSPFRAVKYKNGKPSPAVYKASVKRQEGLKPLGGRRKPFVATIGGETKLVRRKRGIIGRIGETEDVYGPSVPQILKNEETMKKARVEGSMMLQKRLIHEIDVVVNKYAD